MHRASIVMLYKLLADCIDDDDGGNPQDIDDRMKVITEVFCLFQNMQQKRHYLVKLKTLASLIWTKDTFLYTS